ncbi:SIS domain-containing protein [Nocardioides mangrovicus]|uniref:SIS domain-containing protein n=2 Tax=Nocardioides mangrovicus TaxID=2478913 RepID=A0A3L8P349_9ACTN|nr:SIS domain-containing protein [Nocardioides mangrovicus]
MLREMEEQPDAVRRTLEALLPLRSEVAGLFAGRRRVLFVARGSSDNAAIYGRYLLETHAGVVGGLAAPSVATHYRSELDLTDTLVVSVSQSGATEEIVATQDWARSCGGATVAVANVADSPLVRAADLALVTAAGPELAVPATKSYLAQLVAMAVVATALAPAPTALDGELGLVAGEVERLLEQRSGVEEAARQLATTAYTVVSGRGLMMGTALETALKLEETCLRPVRGYSYADLRHGPISVVTAGMTAVLVAAPDGPMLAPMTELAGDLAARGATTIGIGGDAGFAGACSLAVAGPDLPEAVAPMGAIVASQLVVEALARELGLDPDNPRGLAKVTTTDPAS